MIAVISGDIVKSRSADPKIWMPALEEAIGLYANKFDIFRGDSFQAELTIQNVLKAALYIKAAMLALDLDVRMGIGIGTTEYDAPHIKNSFGSALIYSGEAFEELKKETISFKSAYPKLDAVCNVILPLVAELTTRWTSNIAETVKAAFLNEDANQAELAKILDKKYQSQVSTELQKASYTKIQRALDHCTKEMLAL
ncbi:hypothetical protein [Sphingobacterium haloxyli]|uniref:Uncharacterized protein n=1 Tax=Sphingobacterium haloxyli TaxID=2100533 RepID=A0A2S9J2X6_9SPHI|nr:hypothetical protein [Sphingobacterium haloxyli]PRD47143.1 hypothetical protein C5745_12055 [Sphingobacterium haloxyli]